DRSSSSALVAARNSRPGAPSKLEPRSSGSTRRFLRVKGTRRSYLTHVGGPKTCPIGGLFGPSTGVAPTRHQVDEPDTVAQAGLATVDLDRVGEDRAVDDAGVELAVLARQVDPGARELRQHRGVDRLAEQGGGEEAVADGDQDGTEPEVEQFEHQLGPVALPERVEGGGAGRRGDPLDPFAVRVDVDVAEDAGAQPLAPGLDELGRQRLLIVIPGGRGEGDRGADGRRLGFEQVAAQAVGAGALAALSQHRHQEARLGTGPDRMIKRQRRVLATTPGAVNRG